MTDTDPHLAALSESDRQFVRARVAEFEKTWNHNRLAAVLADLPSPGPVRAALLLELVRADLRRQWKKGRRIDVEIYLTRHPELGTPGTVSVELLQDEYLLRLQAGAPMSIPDFVQRFPEQLDALLDRLIDGGTRPPPESDPPSKAKTAAASSVAPSKAQTALPNTSPHEVETELPDDVPVLPRGLAGQELPRQFGRYRLLRVLGAGGMGAVYLAHDTQLDRQVALKVPHISIADGPEVLARFYREARVAATLHHPNICPVHDVGECDGVPYLTMAFIEGEPLNKLVSKGQSAPQRWAADVVRRIAEAMQEAHRQGIIHRDLKPANVHIDQRGEPIVMDFGVARRLTETTKITQSGGVVGTPEYMSPQQVLGEKNIGPDCDIYSLGVILYRLLSGRVPVEGTLGAVLSRIVTEDPPPPSKHNPKVDPRLEAVCLKAMARRVADRYASMTDFAQALDEVLAAGDLPNEPSLHNAVPPPSGSRSRRPLTSAGSLTDVPPTADAPAPTAAAPVRSGRRSGAWLLVLVPVLLLVAGLVAVFIGPTRAPTRPQPASGPGAVASAPSAPTITSAAVTPKTEPASLFDDIQRNRDAARQAMKENRYDAAVRHLDEVLRLKPDLNAARIERSRAYAARGDRDKALGDLDVVLRDPAAQSAETYRERAALCEELKKDDEAATDYSKAIKLDPNDALAYLGRARVRLRQKEYEAAIDDCDEAAKLAPKLAMAWVVRGDANLQQPEPKLGPALDDYARALGIDPQLAAAVAGRGDVFLTQGRLDPAIAEYGKAIELEPKLPRARAGMSEAYQRLGKGMLDAREFAKAVFAFSERLRRLQSAEKASLSFEIGCAYAQRGRALHLQWNKGDLVRALADYDEALQRNPDDAFSRLHRGDALAQMQEWKKADDDLTRAFELNPKDFQAWYRLAHLRLQQGKVDSYRKLCMGAWKEFQNTKDLREINQLIWLCTFTPDSGVEGKGLAELAQKEAVASKLRMNPTYLNTLSAALYRAGRDDIAVQRLEEAIKVRDKKGVVDDWLFLALANQRLGRTGEAQKWRDKAVDGVKAEFEAKPKDGVAPLSWTQRLALQHLRDEVLKKVGKP